MTDLSQYQPPGVYVEDISQDIVTPLNPGLPEALLCIVAPALGYQTASENIKIYSGTDAFLTNTYVVQGVTIVVHTLGGTLLVKDTDYTVTVDNTGPEPRTKFRRLPTNAANPSPGGVIDGDTVKVDYRFTVSNYYLPQVFTDYSALAGVYGPALSTVVGAQNQIVSPLSLAAKVAFENGASKIIGVAVDPTSGARAAYAAAYQLIATDHTVSVVSVVFPEADSDTAAEVNNLLTDLRLHCDQAASNGYGRMAIAGTAASFDETVTGMETVAETVANKRVVLAYPSRMNLYNPNTAQTVQVGGGYVAAALGGRLLLNVVQQSLTRQAINSFTGIPSATLQRMSKAYKDNLSSHGVLVIEPDRLNRLVVRHGVTTDMTALTTREISLVRVADALLVNVQVGLDNGGLIGQPITPDLVIAVKGALTGILEQEVRNRVIVSYAQVLVRQQTLPNGDPSVIECQFSYKPAVPLNYVTVLFSLNLTTGALDTTDTVPTTA